MPWNCAQEFKRLELQAQQLRGSFRPSKPLWKLLQEALLSDRDLDSINSERLQYTQLLYK